MKKVVAFLEKYAEWLALGVACVFLLYMVYSYVVSPEALHVKVGSDTVYPGEVDPHVDVAVRHLQEAIEAPAGDVKIPLPDYSKDFLTAMGTERPHMTEVATNLIVRPNSAEEFRQAVSTDTKIALELPAVPPVEITMSNSGDSLIAAVTPPPAAGADADADAQAQAQPVAPEDPATVLANAVDKKWITIEGKFDVKALADNWKKAFVGPNGKPIPGLPDAVRLTNFLQLEVEREEQTGPNEWGNKVILQPLPLVRMLPYPKEGDLEAQEAYRMWAETHQIDLIEPAFYRILKGDPWYVPSLGAPKDPNDAAAAATPFDPANPNIPFDKMTPEQKRAVYIYNQDKKREAEKAAAQTRKAKSDAANSSRGGSSGGGGGGGGGGGSSSGGRRIGAYAPLPIQLAANPANPDETRRPITPGDRTRTTPTPGARDGITYRRGEARGNGETRRQDYGRGGEYGRGGIPTDTNPTLNPDGQVQNSLLQGPFDPTKVPLDAKGKADVLVWAHDDTTAPGKTYRYRMRVKLKNPLYATFNLAKDPKASEQLALVSSDWSAWKEVTAPRDTWYFFVRRNVNMTTNTVASVNVDVFKNERGEWKKESFQVSPGDTVGGTKGTTNFTTGATIVDLRASEKDNVKILLSDDVGNITTETLKTNDPFYKALLDKVNRPDPTNPTNPAVGAAPGNPALINEVGSGSRPNFNRGG